MPIWFLLILENSISTDYVIKEYDLDEIIRQAIRQFSREFIRKKIGLEFQETKKRIITDEKWLVFVLEQLLSNALKYTKEGKIRIYCNEMMGIEERLNKGEVLAYVNQENSEVASIHILDETFTVKKQLEKTPIGQNNVGNIPFYFVVVPEETQLKEIAKKQAKIYKDDASSAKNYISFDVDGTEEEKIKLYEKVEDAIVEDRVVYSLESKTVSYNSSVSFYAGFLFIGIFFATSYSRYSYYICISNYLSNIDDAIFK